MKALHHIIIASLVFATFTACGSDKDEIPTPDKTEENSKPNTSDNTSDKPADSQDNPSDTPSEKEDPTETPSEPETPSEEPSENPSEPTETPTEPETPSEPEIPTEPETPSEPETPEISYRQSSIITYEDDAFTAFFYAIDDEDYELESNVQVTWNFGDGSNEVVTAGDDAPTHVFPSVGNAEYTVTCTFERDGDNFRGTCTVEFDSEGKIVKEGGNENPPSEDEPTSLYWNKLGVCGDFPLIVSKASPIKSEAGKLNVFVMITGESPRNNYGNGVFMKKDGAVPRDILINDKESIQAEEITLDLGLKCMAKYSMSDYTENQGFGYDNGAKFHIPFYYSAPWMTISSTGGTLDLGTVVIWDLQSKGIFGTGDFEHTTWAWKQSAKITITSADLANYNSSKHLPYVLVTIHANFTDEVNYTWEQKEVRFMEK